MGEEMFDVALATAGAQVALATSCDENFPPENVIDGDSSTFWMTTGLFPQQVVVSFQSLMNIKMVQIMSSAIKVLRIEKSVQEEPVDFEDVLTKELENNEGQSMQKEEFDCSGSAFHLRFSVLSAYDHFVSMHRVNVDGTAAHN